VIDTMTVVRLKDGLGPHHDPKHWGTRTDYLCARLPRFDKGKFPFWLADRWDHVLPKKPTTGLCAVLEAIERLAPAEISLIGFDRLLRPDEPSATPIQLASQEWLAHDKYAEHAYLRTLKAKVFDLGEVHRH
jgi:hypothetical protein